MNAISSLKSSPRLRVPPAFLASRRLVVAQISNVAHLVDGVLFLLRTKRRLRAPKDPLRASFLIKCILIEWHILLIAAIDAYRWKFRGETESGFRASARCLNAVNAAQWCRLVGYLSSAAFYRQGVAGPEAALLTHLEDYLISEQ